MPLKDAHKIRTRIARGIANEIVRIRLFVSMTDNPEAVEKLLGKDGDIIVAKLTDAVLTHIGHDWKVRQPGAAKTSTEAGSSLARRTARGLVGA